MKSIRDKYNALVIGLEKGGKIMASYQAKADWQVALVEQFTQMNGGTGINIACMETKSLVRSAGDQVA